MSNHPRAFNPLQERELAEIDRLKAEEKNVPPSRLQPLSLAEYRAYVRENTRRPGERKIRHLLDQVGSQWRDILLYAAEGGYRVVPVLMDHAHGYPSFASGQEEEYGCLSWYLMRPDGLAIRGDYPVFLNAIFPPEVIENGVTLTKEVIRQGTFRVEMKAAIERLIAMISQT